MNSYPNNHGSLNKSACSEKYQKVSNLSTECLSKDKFPEESLVPENNFTDLNSNPQVYISDNEFKGGDEKSSNDSLSGCIHLEQDYQDYPTDIKKNVKYSSYAYNKQMSNGYENYENLALPTDLREKFENFEEEDIYKSVNDHETTTAKQKFQRLRELQRRRDDLEKCYSYEIQRLIDDQHSSTKNPNSANNMQHEKLFSQRFTDDPSRSIIRNDLESCGTITTITRLDCGCMEQTTRQIFTTTVGHVQKRNCAREKQVDMKLSSPNTSFIHSTPTVSRLKSKSFTEYRNRHSADKSFDRRTSSPPGIHLNSSARKLIDSPVLSP